MKIFILFKSGSNHVDSSASIRRRDHVIPQNIAIAQRDSHKRDCLRRMEHNLVSNRESAAHERLQRHSGVEKRQRAKNSQS